MLLCPIFVAIAGFYCYFRLDIVVRNFDHVDEFVLVTKPWKKENKILIYSKDITAGFLFNLFDTSIISRIIESLCNIVMFSIAADWFSPIMHLMFFAYGS